MKSFFRTSITPDYITRIRITKMNDKLQNHTVSHLEDQMIMPRKDLNPRVIVIDPIGYDDPVGTNGDNGFNGSDLKPTQPISKIPVTHMRNGFSRDGRMTATIKGPVK